MSKPSRIAPHRAPVPLISSSLRTAVRRVLNRLRPSLRTTARAMSAAVVAGLAPAAHPWPAEFQLSRLLPEYFGDGSEGFALEGVADAYLPALLGDVVGPAGGVNADGIADLIISGPNSNFVASSRVVVLYGLDTAQVGLFEPVIDLSTLRDGDGSQGFELNCLNDDSGTCTRVGDVAQGVGDLNGDGIAEIIIEVGGSQSSFVVFGSAQAFPPEFELSTLSPQNGGDGTAGFTLASGATMDVVTGADMSADGLSDLLVGNFHGETGGGFVLFGRPDSSALSFPAQVDPTLLGGDGSEGFAVNGVAPGDEAGIDVAAGDVNGDGIADIVLGARRADPGGRSSAGQVFVVFGRDTDGGASFPPVFELSSLLAANGGDGTEGFVLHGVDNYDQTGAQVAVGDVNGDGIGDVIAGAGGQDPNFDSGRVFVVFGRSLGQGGFPAEIELADLLAANGGDGSEGFVLHGFPGDNPTGSISAGRVNGDGIDDVMLGAAYSIFYSHPGHVYIVFGRPTAQQGFPAELELSDLLADNGGDGTEGFVLIGVANGDGWGSKVSTAADVNGDGFDDVVFHTPFANQVCHPWPYCLYYRGRSYVVFGGENQRPDDDADGVLDDIDVCFNTSVPERIPLVQLANDRYALVDDDLTFEVGMRPGPIPSSITLADTLGCSCDQIITRLGHGRNERRFGCTQQTMDSWIDMVH